MKDGGEGLRLLIAAFGDAGHVFPAISLGRALRARGHEVVIETWEERRTAVEGAGLGFAAAEEYRMFPPPDPNSEEGQHAAEAALALLPLLEEFRPNVVVSDILTLAPTLAAERAGIPLATLIPHIYPVVEPGYPFFAIGLRPPRTQIGRSAWRYGHDRALRVGLEQGRRDEVVYHVGRPGNEGYIERVLQAWGVDGALLQVHLGFPGGAMALLAHAGGPHLAAGYSSFSVIGASGAAYADDHANEPLLFTGGAAHAVRASAGVQALAAMVQNFVDAIAAGKAGELAETLASWRKVLAVNNAVHNALATVRAVRREGA